MTNLSDVRIFLCTTPTNMCYSFDSLMGQAQEVFNRDPLSGHLFLFVNRCRDRIKVLFWDHDGFVIFYKRLEVGAFQMPSSASGQQAGRTTGCRAVHDLGRCETPSHRTLVVRARTTHPRACRRATFG